MDKTNAKHLDSILNELSKIKKPNCLWNSVINNLGIDNKLSDSLLSTLESKKFIIITVISGDRKLVRLSAEGKAFILTSSFLSEESKDNRKRMNNNFTFIIDIIAKFSAIAGTFFKFKWL
jgi:predicted transcriptional regulator